MILDNIKNNLNYSSLNENIAIALKYLEETNFRDLPNGKVEIKGDDVFAIIQRYDTKPLEQGKWEAHRNYIDVQYIADGQELFGVGLVDNMKITQEYDPEADCLFLDGPGDYFRLSSGMFAMLYPHDAHMPGVIDKNVSNVLKVVVKVSVK